MKWLKRIMLAAGAIVALELVAWVGIALLGKDAFRTLLDFYDPRPYVGTVTSSTRADGSVQRCSTFNGELFCIDEGLREGKGKDHGKANALAQNTDAEPQSSRSLGENPSDRDRIEDLQSVETCATLDGDLFCITERRRIDVLEERLASNTGKSNNDTGSPRRQADTRELKERCAFYEGESICIKEKI